MLLESRIFFLFSSTFLYSADAPASSLNPSHGEVDGLHFCVSLDEVPRVPPSQSHAQLLALLQVLDADQGGRGREVGTDLGLLVARPLEAHPHETGALDERIGFLCKLIIITLMCLKSMFF